MPALLTKISTPLFAITTAVLLVTLFFGLRPKGYDFSNKVNRLENRSGFHFDRFGLLYAPLDERLIRKFADSKDFSVKIALLPQRFNSRRFQQILTITNGNDQTQFTMGQWKNSLIIMNGNDYGNRENTWRITQEIDRDPQKETLLTITTGSQGTKLYLDNELTWSRQDVSFSLPSSGRVILTLGNDIYGIHPWQGSIFGLSFYNYELAPEKIHSHFDSWVNNRELKVSPADRPSIFYTFCEQKDTTASGCREDKGPSLILPAMPFLEKIAFSLPLPYSGTTESFLKDSAMNFVGFIPFGFLLVASFSALGRPMTRSIWYTVAVCFCLSVGIEYLQSWMPSRSSQTLDVILNTMGGFTGSFLFKRYGTLLNLRGSLPPRI